jgi:hypothetical protein
VEDDAEETVPEETELVLCVEICLLAAFLAAAAEARVARETVAIPDIGTAGDKVGGDEGSEADRSRPAARRRTPSFMAVLAVGRIEDTVEEVDMLPATGDRLGWSEE